MDEKNYINPDSPVYISYAWGEDLEIDINKLCELMDANGILFKRDKAKGDNSLCPYRYNIINAEEEIGKGKAIIVVLSDKYIKSLNCMYEWHCICKTGNIAQRVFPVVLPGTKLREDWRYNSFRKYFEGRLQKISDKDVESSVDAIERKLIENDGYLKDLEKLRNHLKENNIPDLKSLKEGNYSEIIQQLKAYITKIEDPKKIEKSEEKKEVLSAPPFKIATQSNLGKPEIKDDIKDTVLENANCKAQSNVLFLTSSPPEADASNVIGRKNDLENLWKKLSEKKHVLLTGLGGIGKTKLAQMLFHNYRDRFEEVAWIDYKDDLRHSFLACVNAEKFNKGSQNENERWEAIKSSLLNDGNKKLFIIDNVDDDADQRPENDKELQNLTGWDNTTVLITSRLDGLSPYIQHKLKALGKDDCKAVFNHYYDGNEPDPEWVGKIVEFANCHTLTIELLAKGARRENLESYYDKIKSGFDAVLRRMGTEHHVGKMTIEEHLRILFDIQQRSETDKKVLNGFAVLPVNCECSLEEIGQWFGFENKDLDDLIQDGWLSYDEGKQAFSMHPLVRAIVRFDFADDAQGHKKAIAPEGTTDKILEYYSEASFDIDDGYASLQRRIDIGESVISAIEQEETETLASVLHNLGYGYYKMGDYDKALEYYGKALEISESKLGKDHPDTATTYNNIAGVHYAKGDYDKALEYYGKALEIKESKLGKYHPDTATTYNNIAVVHDAKGDYGKALVYYGKALKISESKLGKDHPSTATTYNNIAEAYRAKGDYDNALEYHGKALEIVESKLGKDHPYTASTYNNIALVYDARGDYDKALEYYEKALRIRESKLGKDHPDTATTYNNIAGVYKAKGDYDKALEYYEKDMKISESKLGKDHPDTATTYNNIGGLYRAKGDYDKSLEYYGKALEIMESKLGKDHPDTATTYNNIAGVHYAKGDYDKALEYFGKALEIVESKLGKDHPYTAATYNNIALVYKAKGDYGKALEYYGKALEIRESKLGKDHPDTATTYNNIAMVYDAKGDYDNALEYFGKALEIKESKLGKDHPDTAATYNNIGEVYRVKGDYDKALEYYGKALEIKESKLGKDHTDTAATYNNIAGVHYAKGDYDNALEYFLKALRIWLKRDVNHPNAKIIFGNLIGCYQAANKEKDFGEWLQEQLSEKEWAAFIWN